MEPDDDRLLVFDQTLAEIDQTLLEVRRFRAAETPECLEIAKLKLLQLRSLTGIAFYELRHCFYTDDNDEGIDDVSEPEGHDSAGSATATAGVQAQVEESPSGSMEPPD